MSGVMTPESLSREGSPTPGEITLHAAPPHNVSASVSASSMVQAVVEPVQQQIVDLQGLQAAGGVLNATVLTQSGQPLNVAHGQPIQLTSPGIRSAGGVATPQKLIVAQPAPRLIVPAHQVLLTSNGTGTNGATQNLEIKKEGNV